MIEYRTERTAPGTEDSVIEILSAFGWQLIDSQEIYHEDTEISGVEVKAYGDGIVGGFMKGFTGRDGEVRIRKQKNVTNYVTLRFGRDTEMPNYSELKCLNEEFEEKIGYDEPKKPIKRTVVTVVAIALILVSVIMAIANGTAAELWEILVCVIAPIVLLPICIVGWVRYKKKTSIYRYVRNRLAEILEEAEQLLCNE